MPMTHLLVLSVPIFLIILYSMAYYFYPERQPTLFLWLQFLIILAIFSVVVVIEVVLVMRATELRISTFLPLVIACINVYGAFALVPVVATIGQRLGIYGRLLVGILAFLSLETLLNLTIGLVEVLPMANGYDFAHQDEWSVFFTIMAYGIHRVFSSPLPPKPGTSLIPIGLYFVGVIVNLLILSLMVSSISTSKA